MKFKIVVLVLICAFQILWLGVSHSEEALKLLQDKYEVKLDKDGKIPQSFWVHQVLVKELEAKIRPVEFRVDLLAQKPCALSEDTYWDYNVQHPGERMTPKILDQIERNKAKIENITAVLEESVLDSVEKGQSPLEMNINQFDFLKIKNSDFYLWNVGYKYFFINPQNPTRAIFLVDLVNRPVLSTDVQKISKDIYRLFFLTVVGGNYCSSTIKTLYVYDFNFSKMTYKRYQCPNGSDYKDINGDGDFKLIFSPDVGEAVHWPWIYSWDGTKWINSSLKYWKLYKNKVVQPEAFCAGRGSDLFLAFQTAVLTDEPLKYWK